MRPSLYSQLAPDELNKDINSMNDEDITNAETELHTGVVNLENYPRPEYPWRKNEDSETDRFLV